MLRLSRSKMATHSASIATLEHMESSRTAPALSPRADRTRQERRSLPTRAVTNGNLDDAYVNFILYCNPMVALDTDTTELRKSFRAPPKSDGKSFSTFTLFRLIEKLEQKEIKTWAQLALDLGVEAPSSEKGQSTQKVQQYAVRLKVSGGFQFREIFYLGNHHSITKSWISYRYGTCKNSMSIVQHRILVRG